MISKLNPDTKRVWRPMCVTDFAVSSTEFIIFEANIPAFKDFVFSIIDSAAFQTGCVPILLARLIVGNVPVRKQR